MEISNESYHLPKLMNKDLINQTSIKLGQTIAQLQKLQANYDDPAITKLLYHIAEYQEKLVTAIHQLAVTTEKEIQAA
ncbi:MAG: hypothetical protein WA865_01895 [Spirulinaceae cyanobacterium]